MPYLQVGVDSPFGAIPYDKVLRIGRYLKDASAARIFAGDFVILESDGGVAVATAGATNILGVAAASGAASTEDVNFMVYDHPDQLFAVQDDSDTTHMAEAQIGQNFDILATTGNTVTDRSAMEIDSSSATAATANVRVLAQHPIEDRSFATAAGTQRKWVVAINEHLYKIEAGI